PETPDVITKGRGFEIADLHEVNRVTSAYPVFVKFKMQGKLQRDTPRVTSESQAGRIRVHKKCLSCHRVRGRRRAVEPVVIPRPGLGAAKDAGRDARIL